MLELLGMEIEPRQKKRLAKPGGLCPFGLALVCLSYFVICPILVSISDENFFSSMRRSPLREVA